MRAVVPFEGARRVCLSVYLCICVVEIKLCRVNKPKMHCQ